MAEEKCFLKKEHQIVPLLLNPNGKMNSLQLPNKWSNFLLNLPESGMGYQLVRVFLKNGKVLRKQKVLNSSCLLLEPPEKISERDIEKIELEK